MALVKAIEKAEGADISFGKWIAGFLSVLAIRFFLENFSSPTPSFAAAPDVLTLVHYTLFYLAVYLSLALFVSIFIRDIKRVSKLFLLGLPVIWLPPLLDLIFSHGTGAGMAYIFAGGQSLAGDFFQLGTSSAIGGITAGIQIEIVCIMAAVFTYVFLKKKNIVTSIVAALGSYAIIFFWIAFPSFMTLMLGVASPAIRALPVASFLTTSFLASRIVQNFIMPTTQFSYEHGVEALFNIGMSYAYYLADLVLAAAWLYAYRSKTFWELLKNARPERIAHYFFLIALGVIVAASKGGGVVAFNWVDAIAFVCLAASYVCAWLFAVGVNDLNDAAIDSISNKDRPLVNGGLENGEMQSGNMFFLGWSLLGGFLGGYWAMFTMFTFTAAYYAYSAVPLRLKRVPILSTGLISLAGLAVAMSGFYFLSAARLVSDFPAQYVWLIIVGLTLGATIKDVKDIEGDCADGIKTIPVLFGEKNGKRITGGLLAAAFLLVPVVLGINILFIPSFIAAIVGYILINAKTYREWKVFALYFAYAAVAVALVLLV